MFYSLLQTIPTLSGNFTIACKLNNIKQKNHKVYETPITDAIITCLDSGYSHIKDLPLNLRNSKYEYDIKKYFKLMSGYFYTSSYNYHEDYEYYEKSQDLFDDKDKTFEFGCKRISFNKNQNQFSFYAPIYCNNFNDLPDYFEIHITNDNKILKKIRIPIKVKDVNNYLRIYLNNFLEKLETNIPIVLNFNDNNLVYNNSIDCKNGGLVNFISYNFINNKESITNNMLINDVDRTIANGYKDNNLIISECIPLSFLFNINDFISPSDIYYYGFNGFKIKGFYMKNGNYCDFYDFSTNYHYKSIKYNNKISYNLFDNDILFTLKEASNEKLYHENTVQNKYCQFSLYETDKYIVNISTAVKNNFPILKYQVNLDNFSALLRFDYNYETKEIINNLIIPNENNQILYNNNKNVLDKYNTLINNNYTNWFSLFNSETMFNNHNLWSDIINSHTYYNGIVYDNLDKNCKYFGVFVNPIIQEYNENLILGHVIHETNDSTKQSIVIDNEVYSSNMYFEPIDISDLDEIPDDLYIKDNIYDKYYVLYSDFEKILENNEIKNYILNFFNYEYGYIKIDIFNINEDILKELKSNKNIYFSMPNKLEKINLETYYNKRNYKVLLEDQNIKWFIKEKIVHIGDIEYVSEKIQNEIINDVLSLTYGDVKDNETVYNYFNGLLDALKEKTYPIVRNIHENDLSKINKSLVILSKLSYNAYNIFNITNKIQHYIYISYLNENDNLIVNSDYYIKDQTKENIPLYIDTENLDDELKSELKNKVSELIYIKISNISQIKTLTNNFKINLNRFYNAEYDVEYTKTIPSVKIDHFINIRNFNIDTCKDLSNMYYRSNKVYRLSSVFFNKYYNKFTLNLLNKYHILPKNQNFVICEFIHSSLTNTWNNVEYQKYLKKQSHNILFDDKSVNVLNYEKINRFEHIKENNELSKLTKKELKNSNYNFYIKQKIDVTASINIKDEYQYILINCPIYLGLKSFNIQNNKLDIPIQKVNNINILENNYLRDIFKQIYPFIKYDLLTAVYDDIKDYIQIPYEVIIANTYIPITNDNTKLSKKVINQANIQTYTLLKYFNNIMPLFYKVNSMIADNYHKIFTKLKIKKYDIKEDIDTFDTSIYGYPGINVTTKINKNNKQTYANINQIEYKHYNDNLLYNLPKELIFDNIAIINIDQLKEYKTTQKCLEYFKLYIKNHYYNKLNDDIMLFLFNKYSITYEDNIVSYNLNKQPNYLISYKLVLL